jgi:flagellar hook-associated protein 2
VATVGSTTVPGSTIDVANIVSQLMAVEQKPLNAIDAKISKSDIKISAFGAFQAKLGAFNDALKALEAPSNFDLRGVNSSLPSVATVALTEGATASVGRFALLVSKTAESARVNIKGFTAENQAIANASAYSITVGGQTYTPQASDGITNLTQLRDWINNKTGLQTEVQATLVRQSTGNWVLSLQGLATGAGHQLSVITPGGGISSQTVQDAQDAIFTMNGIEFTRSTNTISDAIDGLTLNLISVSTSPTVIEVTKDTTATRPAIAALVNSYNDLLKEFKQDTSSSLEPSQRGVLNGDSTLSYIMRQINDGLNRRITNSNGASLGNNSYISLLGIEFKSDGSLSLNDTLLNASTQLNTYLAKGIKLGFVTGAENLQTTVSSILADSGALANSIQAEKTNQSDLNQRKTKLQQKLVSLQERYTAQYAALDALLFKLNNTSTSLKSALDALTASQKNN